MMHDMRTKMIHFLRENRISTEEVADCLGKCGLVPDAKPIKQGNFCVGIMQYVYGFDDSNWPVHEQIRDLQPERILFVDDINIHERALFGHLVSKYIFEKKKALAVVTCGSMRDIKDIRRENYFVWCGGITPIGCFNKKVDLRDEIVRTVKKHREYYEGSIAVCDDSGVVVIPKDRITEEFFDKLREIRKQEKLWFECVLNRQWDTYDTVCLKKYLT